MSAQILFFFFFASRRRHTRSKRDWSSDVCSSDLGPALRQRGVRRVPRAAAAPGREERGPPRALAPRGARRVRRAARLRAPRHRARAGRVRPDGRDLQRGAARLPARALRGRPEGARAARRQGRVAARARAGARDRRVPRRERDGRRRRRGPHADRRARRRRRGGRDGAARGVGRGRRRDGPRGQRGILWRLRARHVDHARYTPGALRGADAPGGVPSHARADPSGGRAHGVRGARPRRLDHPPDAPRDRPTGARPDGEGRGAEGIDRTMNRRTALAAGLLALLALGGPAWAFDNEQTFAKGTYVFSFEGGYGEQFNLEGHRVQSDVAFFNLGIRAALLPFDRFGGGGPLQGALELGVEPLYQHYTEPKPASWGGVAAVARYHFLGLGRLVPYAELAGAAGGTDLRVREIASDLSFLLWGGVGV